MCVASAFPLQLGSTLVTATLVPPSAEESARPIAMPPLITATTSIKVHSVDENRVGAKNGGGIYRWPEFDSRAGVSRLQPYGATPR